MKTHRDRSTLSRYSFLLIIFAIISFKNCFSQSRSGTVLFERRLNTNFQMLEMLNVGGINADAYQKYIVNNPKFRTTTFNLYFNADTTIYLPYGSGFEAVSNDEWFTMCAYNNKIQTILSENIVLSEKEIFGSKYRILDSLKDIKWKITSEIRDIAGYECRRANAVVMDSIYIVAFYCPHLQVSGGPESFHGLPGMILGLALPHAHITWFAKEVTLNPSSELQPNKIPINGSEINQESFHSKINEFIKSWGPVGGLIQQRSFL